FADRTPVRRGGARPCGLTQARARDGGGRGGGEGGGRGRRGFGGAAGPAPIKRTRLGGGHPPPPGARVFFLDGGHSGEANPSIQNNSGLPQGLAGAPIAG